MSADGRLGVVQGCTRTPEDAPIGNWTLTRQIDGPTPYFEGLNIFYRRAALEGTGGFDEEIANYGEDAALGWAVVDAGWLRGYAADAVVYHDAEERGVRYHLWAGLLERNVALIAKRHPRFREEAFWRPWAFRSKDAKFTLALVGVLVAVRRPAALVASVPYAHHLYTRRPSRSSLKSQGRWFLERIAVDAAQFVGMRVGSIRHRVAVL
jgi:GT2 family glycosyltransferase